MYKYINVYRDIMSVILFFSVLRCASGNIVFHVSHAQGERSYSELRAHDAHRYGRLLAAMDLPLGGTGRVDGSGLFYTKIGIGNPSKDYRLQVDTGSDTSWVNCAGCTSCPKETNLNIKLARYDIKGSKTGKIITCDEEFCTRANHGLPRDCDLGRACGYSVSYADGSTTTGYCVRDELHLRRASGTHMSGSIIFGCGLKQSGLLDSSDGLVDGIIGFGQAYSSVVSQLASAGKVKRVFSHCLDGRNGGGIFAIGEVMQPNFSSTPMIRDRPHYEVFLKAIEVDGDVLQLQNDMLDDVDNIGTVIDSGATLAYLPDEIWQPLTKKIMAGQPGLQTRWTDLQNMCFPYKGNVDDGFPVITFRFKDSLSLSVYPHDYLFSEGDDDHKCIGWMNTMHHIKDDQEAIILGDMALSNKLVVYDLENQTIGWTEYNCSSSIKVKDDQSENVYSVNAHNLSAASPSSRNKDGKLLKLLLLMPIVCNLI